MEGRAWGVSKAGPSGEEEYKKPVCLRHGETVKPPKAKNGVSWKVQVTQKLPHGKNLVFYPKCNGKPLGKK